MGSPRAEQADVRRPPHTQAGCPGKTVKDLLKEPCQSPGDFLCSHPKLPLFCILSAQLSESLRTAFPPGFLGWKRADLPVAVREEEDCLTTVTEWLSITERIRKSQTYKPVILYPAYLPCSYSPCRPQSVHCCWGSTRVSRWQAVRLRPWGEPGAL